MSQPKNIKSMKKTYEGKNRPTLSRIAELSDISVAYLSLILSGKRVAPPNTEERILNAYQEAWEEMRG